MSDLLSNPVLWPILDLVSRGWSYIELWEICGTEMIKLVRFLKEKEEECGDDSWISG